MDARLSEAVAGALEVNLAELLRQRLVQELTPVKPAVGAEWSVKVPNVAYWELLSIAYVLTTSAVVANRRTTVQVLDGNGLVVGEVDAIAVQAAGVGQQYVYSEDVGTPQTLVADSQGLPAHGVPLTPGWSIATKTALLDVGDQYSAIVVVIREWSFEELVRQAEWLERHLPPPHDE